MIDLFFIMVILAECICIFYICKISYEQWRHNYIFKKWCNKCINKHAKTLDDLPIQAQTCRSCIHYYGSYRFCSDELAKRYLKPGTYDNFKE